MTLVEVGYDVSMDRSMSVIGVLNDVGSQSWNCAGGIEVAFRGAVSDEGYEKHAAPWQSALRLEGRLPGPESENEKV